MFVHGDWGAGPVSENYKAILLIDKESFRIVSWISEKDYSREPDGTPGVTSWQMDTRIDYYDFNQPIVVDLPDEYIKWSEPAVSN